jgi:autotransporter-associated beta strand protein
MNFTVTAASNNIFGNTSGLYVDIGATVDFNSNLQTVGDLSGNGTIILGDLTVNIEKTRTTKDSTFDGTLDGAGSLTKDGNGVLILSGANTYSGATNINAGTMILLLVFIPVSGSGKNCFSILSLRTVIRIMNIGTIIAVLHTAATQCMPVLSCSKLCYEKMVYS